MAARRLNLPDGRSLAYDDVGDPRGVPVVYLHGTPDSRLARHPDDSIAARCGVRLLAVDRPGAGDSDLHPAATLTSLGEDLAALLDALGVPDAALLGWSSGALAALGAATVLGPRASAVLLVASIPPVEAYDDAAVLDALGRGRRAFAELAREVPPEELAAELAAQLVPQPLTPELALEHVLEGAGEAGRADLASVPGSAEALAAGLQAGVARGLAGVEQQLRHQLAAGLDLARVTAPVRSVHGRDDAVSPPTVGRWLAERLPAAVDEPPWPGSHHLLFPRWQSLLEALRLLAAGGSE